MAIYSLGQRTTNFTVNQASSELRTGTPQARLLELTFHLNASQNATWTLGRPQARGITPVNVAFQPYDPADAASATNCALSWATSPTKPKEWIRIWTMSGGAGVGCDWFFGQGGLVIPANDSLVIWNATTNFAADITQVIDE